MDLSPKVLFPSWINGVCCLVLQSTCHSSQSSSGILRNLQNFNINSFPQMSHNCANQCFKNNLHFISLIPLTDLWFNLSSTAETCEFLTTERKFNHSPIRNCCNILLNLWWELLAGGARLGMNPFVHLPWSQGTAWAKRTQGFVSALFWRKITWQEVVI